PEAVASIGELACCRFCGSRLLAALNCPRCRRTYPVRDGILHSIGPLTGRNRIAAAFYDGPGWGRFRPWEQGFLILQGGVRKARLEILRHVPEPRQAHALGLEVGIGDGANLAFLAPGWTVYGVDIARTRLEACIRSHPQMLGRLAWAEAECLPF